MITGMLWLDNDPKTSLADKIERAADYFEKKYGRRPELCLVNPNTPIPDLSPESGERRQVTVRHYKPVLPGHLWLGFKEKIEAQRTKNAEEINA